MADCKKYNGSTWVHSLRKLGTDTDTITTLPADVYADGTTATVGLKGQTVQSSTPSPASPVTPQGCGERTGNLINSDTYYGSYKQSDGTYQTTRDNLYDVKIKPFTSADIGKTFTFSANISPTTGNTRLSANINGTVINGSFAEKSVLTFTVETINDSIFFNYGSGTTTVTTLSQVMLNEGSTARPYEPNGIKIPISSASTTTPVYLGEVQTTRKVKKLVLTGQESTYTAIDTARNIFTIRGVFNQAPQLLQVGGFCTHYKYNNAISSLAQNMSNGDFALNKIVEDYSFTIRDNSFSTQTEFQRYVQQQYAAGTPVTVWYVLSSATTGIVNEPLMKIGDYADEVANVSIPLSIGSNSVDVETTVKPSEVSLAYTGWHDAEVIEIT